LVAKEKTHITAMSVKMRAEVMLLGRGLYRGCLLSQYLEEPYEFFSFVRMINKMEEIFDDKNFPQAFLSLRSFRSKKDRTEKFVARASAAVSDVLHLKHHEGSSKSSCTFDIHVRFRQKATWQGQIHWLERGVRLDFRSELEMLRLMDKAMIDAQESSEQVTWQRVGISE